MKCFLIAQETWLNTEEVFNNVCPSLINVASLPFIEWQIENLVTKGVKEIRISGGHFTSLIEKQVGNGERWGIDISYIVCQEGKSWSQIFPLNRSFFRNSEKGLLLIRGNILFLREEKFQGDIPTFFNEDKEDFIFLSSNLAGAAYIPEKDIEKIIAVGFSENSTSCDTFEIFETPLSLFDLTSSLLQSNDKFGSINLPHTYEGSYIHESSLIHSEAQLSAPCVIGKNTKIEKGAVISAFSSIGDNSIIDSNAIIRTSIIDSNTYIGKGSVIDSSIISNRRMYSKKTDSAMFIPNKFWVDSVKNQKKTNIESVSLMERLSALFIWLLYLPKLILAGCKRQTYKTVIASTSRHDYKGHQTTNNIKYRMDKTLPPHLAVLSALPEVIKGKMHLCGRSALSPEQINTIPPDFIEIFLPAKPGIITIPENIICNNCFNRRVQDLYLCGKVGFIKRLSFFLESLQNLRHSKISVGFSNEYGLKIGKKLRG